MKVRKIHSHCPVSGTYLRGALLIRRSLEGEGRIVSEVDDFAGGEVGIGTSDGGGVMGCSTAGGVGLVDSSGDDGLGWSSTGVSVDWGGGVVDGSTTR